MAARARSIVMDLFGEYLRDADHAVRLSALSELLSVFGVESASGRVTVSRMRKEGWFTTSRVGRETVYQLSDHMAQVFADGRRRMFTRVDEEWDGWWTQVVYQVPESARAARESLRKQLLWLGFGQFAASVWMSPHHPDAEVEALRSEFDEATIDVLRTRTIGRTGDHDLARRCWDLGELDTDYRDFIQRYGSATENLVGAPALIRSVNVLADIRRLTFRDPELPLELQPADWPGREAFTVFRREHARLAPAARAYVRSVTGTSVATD